MRMRKDLAEVGVPEAVEEQHLSALMIWTCSMSHSPGRRTPLYVVLDNWRSGLSAAIACQPAGTVGG